MEIVTSGAFATIVLEGIKWVVRKLKKDMLYDFNPEFYTFMIPVLTYLAVPVLALLDVSGYTLPTDLLAWVKSFVVAILGSAISVLIYNGGIKSLKAYSRAQG